MKITEQIYYPNQFEFKSMSTEVDGKKVSYHTTEHPSPQGVEKRAVFSIYNLTSTKKILLHKGEKVPGKYKVAYEFLKKEHEAMVWKAPSQKLKI